MEENNNNSHKKEEKPKKQIINISKPTKNGHNQNEEINPIHQINQPSDFKLGLNLEAKHFIPKPTKNLLNEKNKTPYQGSDLMQFGMNYPQGFAYPNMQMNVNYPYNNYQINIEKNNLIQKNINNQKKSPPTLLKLDAKSFIPKSRKKNKNENKDEIEEEKKELEKKDNKDSSNLLNLNINSIPYKRRNLELKKKELMNDLNKEEENEMNPLDSILSNIKKIKEEDKDENNLIKKELTNLLNLLTTDKYNTTKEKIFEIIKNDINIQYKFSELLFQQVLLEKEDIIELYSKLVKDLDKKLPQKYKKKENDKKHILYSEL